MLFELKFTQLPNYWTLTSRNLKRFIREPEHGTAVQWGSYRKRFCAVDNLLFRKFGL